MSQETARQLQRKYELSGTGSFVAVSDAFPDAPALCKTL
jgi:hypothetical protein